MFLFQLAEVVNGVFSAVFGFSDGGTWLFSAVPKKEQDRREHSLFPKLVFFKPSNNHKQLPQFVLINPPLRPNHPNGLKGSIAPNFLTQDGSFYATWLQTSYKLGSGRGGAPPLSCFRSLSSTDGCPSAPVVWGRGENSCSLLSKAWRRHMR